MHASRSDLLVQVQVLAPERGNVIDALGFETLVYWIVY